MKHVLIVDPARMDRITNRVAYSINALPVTPEAPDVVAERVGALLALLTPRQREVMELYAAGVGRIEIAELLGITPYAVRHHRERAIKTMRAGRKPYVGGRAPAPCGTPSAYVRHRRRGEAPCAPCTQAHSAYRRSFKARRRAQ